MKSKAENHLEFQQHSTPAQRVSRTVKLLCWEMPYFVRAPNLWPLNISDFSPVDYRILVMLQKWVCQCPICGMSISWGNVWSTDLHPWSLLLVHLPGPLWKSLIALFGMLHLVYGTNSPLIFASLVRYSLLHFHLSHMAVLMFFTIFTITTSIFSYSFSLSFWT